MGTPQRPSWLFDTAGDFHDWLLEHHASAPDVWTILPKKRSTLRGLTYLEALREAVRFGWVDSVEQRWDADAVRLRWSPRRRDSHWSEANLELAAELTASGQMHPAGAAAYQRALADEHGARVRAQVTSGHLPDAYEALLAADPVAWRFFHERAPASYRAMCIDWVCGAKRPDTRDRRASDLLAACAAERVINPLASGPTPAWARTPPAQDGLNPGSGSPRPAP